MTSAQTMLCRLALVAAAVALLPGCGGSGPKLTPPSVIPAPYDTAQGDVLWAVVPLRNESGTSTFDVLRFSDEIVASCSEIPGIATVPINRTLSTMRALGMKDLESADDVRTLANEMGVDGIIVGSVTAYDPYRPTFGVALALYAIDNRMYVYADPGALDVRSLTWQPTEYKYFYASSGDPSEPVSVMSTVYDGENHSVKMQVKNYATGRHDTESALGWERYIKSMVLFTKFAAHRSVDQLIQNEWIRVTKAMGRQSQESP